MIEEELFCDGDLDPEMQSKEISERLQGVNLGDEPPISINADIKNCDGDEDSSAFEYSDNEKDEPCYDDLSKYDLYDREGQLVLNTGSTFQPKGNTMSKYVSKINVNLIPNVKGETVRFRDKSNKATVEQVFDGKTKRIVYKYLNRKIITEINGCISTGKEANVFHCWSSKGEDDRGTDYAMKVYKVTTSKFLNRGKYVVGDHRLAGGYKGTSSRKKICEWAMKEFRNLKKMREAGVNVPEAFDITENVLLMEYIGTEDGAAPKLKDAKLTDSVARRLYRDMIIAMWKIYNECKLIHADLSEFNILYYKRKLYIIDVSQSVEHEHPLAFDFLRTDIKNITDFFKKNNVAVLTYEKLFDFITNPLITKHNMEECLDTLNEDAGRNSEPTEEEKIQQEVFQKIYIPKHLNDVIEYERDINELKEGKKTDAFYTTLVGLKSDLSGIAQKPEILQKTKVPNEDCGVEESSDESSEEEEEEESQKESKFVNSARPRKETSEEKKARKQAVKDQKAGKRDTKMRKKDKKRLIKISRK